MDQEKYKIIFTGGGTGGHVFPLVSIIREMKEVLPKEKLELHYIGPRDEISEKYIKEEGVRMHYILTGKLRRYLEFRSFMSNLLDIFFKIPIGVVQSFFNIFIISPDLIFSKGGHGSLPPMVSGKVLQVPIFLHESDIVPGMVNRMLQRISSEVFASFPRTEGVDPKKMITVGNPVRKEIIGETKEKGREFFKIKGEKPILLIMGGSQGSERINDIVLEILNELLENFELLHQCGKRNYQEVSAEANAVIENKELKKNYHLYDFFDEESTKHAYACADLVVSRAGAGSIFEIAANGKPSVLLPLPEAAQDHQARNAYFYSHTGAAVVLEEGNFTPHFFFDKLRQLFNPPSQLKVMSDNAKNFARPKAAHVISSYIKEYLIR